MFPVYQAPEDEPTVDDVLLGSEGGDVQPAAARDDMELGEIVSTLHSGLRIAVPSLQMIRENYESDDDGPDDVASEKEVQAQTRAQYVQQDGVSSVQELGSVLKSAS